MATFIQGSMNHYVKLGRDWKPYWENALIMGLKSTCKCKHSTMDSSRKPRWSYTLLLVDQCYLGL